jgi:hypothetical protein
MLNVWKHQTVKVFVDVPKEWEVIQQAKLDVMVMNVK